MASKPNHVGIHLGNINVKFRVWKDKKTKISQQKNIILVAESDIIGQFTVYNNFKKVFIHGP